MNRKARAVYVAVYVVLPTAGLLGAPADGLTVDHVVRLEVSCGC